MNIHFSEKQLVGIFCVLFAVSALFLFWQNKRELDPNFEKSWWTLSFAEAKNENSLAFTIENFSDISSFQYQIVSEKTVLSEEDLTLQRGEIKTVTPTINPQPGIRTSIIVTAGTEKKEIYR